MGNLILKAKKLIFHQTNEIKINDSLQHAHLDQFLDEQVSIQKNRMEIQKEKIDSEIEKLYNDFYNYSTSCNQNIETLKKGYERYIVNKRSEFDVRIQQLKTNNQVEAIEQLENAYAKLVADKKIRLESRIERINGTQQSKQNKFKTKIEKLKLSEEEFLKEIQDDANVKINKINNQVQQVASQANDFYDRKRATLDHKFFEAKSIYEQTTAKIENDLKTHQISLNQYEEQKFNLNHSYSKQFQRFQNQATKNSPVLKKLKAMFFMNNLLEKEKIINGATRTTRFINQSKLIIFFLIISLFTGVIFKGQYYSEQNWFGAILGSNIPIAFIALGETLVILTGGIDLSVGSMIGFGGTVYMSLAYGLDMHWLASLTIMFISLILIGGLSGFLISRLKIPPFIITLAGLLTLRGAVTIILKGVPISATADPLLSFFNYNINETFPVSILVLLVVSIILITFIKFSKFGRYVYAVGDNQAAAIYSGINSKKILNLVYLISAVLAGFGAITALSQINSVSPQTGQTLELDAITAVALGGTSFAGGKGGLVKTLIGWFSISLLINALNFWGVDSNYQFVVKGIVIVIALIIDRDFNLRERFKGYYYKTLSYF